MSCRSNHSETPKENTSLRESFYPSIGLYKVGVTTSKPKPLCAIMNDVDAVYG